MANLGDLHKQIESAGIPIFGVSGSPDALDKVRIDFKGSATTQQKQDAQAIVLGFDASEPGQDDLSKLVDSLELQASLDDKKFEAVYLKVARARIVKDQSVKKQLCSEIQQMLES